MKIYLSPANHYKPYVIAGYTEKPQCEDIAKIVEQKLKNYKDVVPYYTTVFNSNQQYTGRPQEAKKVKADLYVAIHTNSAAKMGQKATGSVGFYHTNDSKGIELATNITTYLDKLCPIPSNRYNTVLDGMKQYNGVGLGEIREPYNLGITPVLIECNFHSYQPTASYIIDHHEDIANCIVRGIVKTYNLVERDDLPMTDAEKKYVKSLEDRINALEGLCSPLYNTEKEIPSWATKTKEMIQMGVIKGDGEGYKLSSQMVRENEFCGRYVDEKLKK